MERISIKSGAQFATLSGNTYAPSTATNAEVGTTVPIANAYAVRYDTPQGPKFRLFGVTPEGTEIPCTPLKGVRGDFIAVAALPLVVYERDPQTNKLTSTVTWQGTCWQALDGAALRSLLQQGAVKADGVPVPPSA